MEIPVTLKFQLTLADLPVFAALLIGWFFGGMLGAPSAVAEDGDHTTPRIPLVVLPFENESGDPEMRHWSHAAAWRIDALLDHFKPIRIIPGSTFGMRELEIEAGDPIDAEKARRIGELTEARWVLWGNWAKRDNHWHLTTRILATVGGDQADEATATSEDWFAATEQAAEQILEMLRIEPAEAERREMEERPTDSLEAYDLYVRARILNREDGSHKKIESLLRKAVEIDPAYHKAQIALATTLLNLGNDTECEALARRALNQKPEDADSHALMAFVFSRQNDAAGVERECREAIRLDPEHAKAHEALGAIAVIRKQWRDAAESFARARELNPFESEIHARLANAHIQLGDREAGLRFLQEAERLVDEDINAEFQLALVYRLLAEYPQSAQHLEKALALGRKEELDSDFLRQAAEMLENIKARLTPTFVEATRPRVFSPGELQSEMAKRLTPEELALAANPVEISPEMKVWAREITASADSDRERAQMLFDTLTHRVRGRGKGGSRTARESFEVWDDPEATFSCQEYAKLFVGLAREVGLDAFYVHLEKDYRGDIVYHDCASLFVDEKALLVDPSYQWFGVPHQEFEILNDLETIAHHAFQGRNDGVGIPRCRLAVKLHPDHAWGQIAAARAYLLNDEIESAEEHLARAFELEPDRWDGLVIRSIIAGKEGNPQAALKNLRRALDLNPRNSEAQFYSGEAFRDLDEHEKALESYRAALRHDDGYHDEIIEVAQQRIAEVSAVMDALRGDDGAIDAMEVRARADAQNNLGVYYSNRPDPDYDEAIRWFRQAAEHADATAHRNLGIALVGRGEYEEAIACLRRAVELNPDSAPSRENLGIALGLAGRFQEAHAALKAALPEGERAPESLEQGALFLEALVDKESQLVEILREKGADDPSVAALLREISDIVGTMNSLPSSADAVRAFWESHREEVAKALESVVVRTITIKKFTGDPARPVAKQEELVREIHNKLADGVGFAKLAQDHSGDSAAGNGGLRGEVTRGMLMDELNDAAFSLQPGEISEVIETKSAWFILNVEGRQSGTADRFDAPGVREAAEKLLKAQRRLEWQEEYLEWVQNRIEEDGGK